jgi:hypothetical protein
MGFALAAAGAQAAMMLEVRDPAELATVERCVPPAVIGLALLMVEADPVFAPRWASAGTDWVARGEILHEALIFLLTPEPAQPAPVRQVAPETELERLAARG